MGGAAIALEAVVKLVALLAVGILVVYGLADGPAEIFARAAPGLLHAQDLFGPRWITLTFLAAAAVICLPREFQVMVVEHFDEQHLRTASWLFPLYPFLITLFVLPIAIAGLSYLPAGSDPDMFVLTLPMWAHQEGIALLALLGGFSSATSMVMIRRFPRLQSTLFVDVFRTPAGATSGVILRQAMAHDLSILTERIRSLRS